MTTTSTPTRAMRLAAAAGTAYQRVFATSRVAPLLSRPRPVRRSGYELDLTVQAVRAEADDVVSVVLTDPDGRALPTWIPGAHLDVFLPSGRQRQYSMCGDPGDRSSYRIAVRRIDGGEGGSREIHDTVHAGGTLRVRGPRNAFPLAAADAYLFVAAGIGITPILPMVRACHDRGVPWRLVYLGRSRASMPFLGELAALDSGPVEIRADDECGPPSLGDILALAPDGAAVYLCGPPALMRPARELLRAGNPRASLHTERFSPLPVGGGAPFEVFLRRTGVTIEVGPGETALTAIGRVADVPYSCRQGFCGTCKVRVLDGDVEHRDRLLAPADRRDSMLLCVSRATGRLVIDR